MARCIGCCLTAAILASCAGDDDNAAVPAASTDVSTTGPAAPTTTDVSTTGPAAPTTTDVSTTEPAAAPSTTEVLSTTDDAEGAPPASAPFDGVARADVSLFDYDASPEVPYEVIDSRDFRGVEFERIKFESPLGGTAYGYLARPVGEPVPGVGVLRAHGMPADGTDEFIPMSMLACAGVPSIVIDAPYARPGANRMGDPLWFTAQDVDEQVQLIVDMRRGLDLLEGIGAERFGFGGMSHGSAVGGLLLGVEPRIEVAVLLVGNPGTVARFFDEDGEPTWPLDQRTEEEIEAWRAAMLPIEPIRFIGDSDADILFMNGEDDPVVPPAEAERLHAAASPGSEVVWMDIGHDVVFEDMQIHNHWFGEHLGIDLDRLDQCTADLFPNGWDDL